MIVREAIGEPGAVLVAVKAVPGARRDEVVGPLGDRLKVRVSAPPEDGKANRAIEAVLAKAIGLKPRDVEVVQGHAGAEKIVRIRLGSEPAGPRAALDELTRA